VTIGVAMAHDGARHSAGMASRATPLARSYAVFGVSVVLWMALWAATNPPGAAPDEPSHLVKAIATGQGELFGRHVPAASLIATGAFDADQLRQVERASRGFTVAPRLATVTGPPCTAFRQASAACLARPPAVPPTHRPTIIVGAYPPWLYAPGGVLAWFAPNVTWAYRLVRAASVVVCAGLLAAALTLLRDGAREPRLVLAGAAVAVTPMAVFLGAQAGASGPEVFGGLAAGAAALRLSRDAVPSPRIWRLAGAATAVAALARPLAPLWTVLAIGIAVGRLGPRGAWRRLRAGGRDAAGAGAAVGLAVAATVGWTQAMGLRTPVLIHRLPGGFAAAWRAVPVVLRGAVGVFGWQDTPMPWEGYRLWWLLAVAGALAAVVLGRGRDRWVLLGACAGLAAAYEAVAAAVFEQNGFGMQARYILPALVMLPLLAAEALSDRAGGSAAGAAAPTQTFRARQVHAMAVALAARSRRVDRSRADAARAERIVSRAVTGTVGLTAAVQLLAFTANAHRYAVGVNGPWLFLDASQWSPPGGWPVWCAGAAVAVLCGFAAAVGAARNTGGSYDPTQGGSVADFLSPASVR
jgi:Predicted membrane protein (DUF2142)